MTNLVKYESNGLAIDTRIEDDRAWITYDQTAGLFGVAVSTVKEHVASILSECELSANCRRNFRLEVAHGSSSRFVEVTHLSDTMVMHVGYRVRSDRGSEFRRWATSVIKGETVALRRVPTPAEQLLANAQLLVEQERRLALTEQKVAAIEATFAEREAHVAELSELPAPAVPAPPKTCGQLVVEAVRGWGNANNKGFQEGFRKLYREVEYRCGIDLKARKRNKPKLRMMDIIDGCVKSQEVYAVACEIFHVGRAA